MATKEDILEQVVEEYLIHRGYFVMHNLKFLPDKSHKDFISNKDSNHGDIDVIGYNPNLTGAQRVMVVSCKSWQGGFKIEQWLDAFEKGKVVSGRAAWKGFRELLVPKWTDGFIAEIEKKTSAKSFTYVIAVTKVIGDCSKWENHRTLKGALKGNPIKILTFEDMVQEVFSSLTGTLASSEVGRLLQLFKASGMLFIK
jgi:hypothetical protein